MEEDPFRLVRTTSENSSRGSQYECVLPVPCADDIVTEAPKNGSVVPPELPRNGNVRHKHKVRQFPYIIAQAIARSHFADVSNVLQLIPLRFRATSDEQLFITHLLPAYTTRTTLAGSIVGVAFGMMWITYAVTTSIQTHSIGHSFSSLITFHLTLLAVCFSFVFYYLVSRVSYFKAYLESVVHGVLVVVTLLPQWWTLFVTVLFRSNYSSVTPLNVQQLKLWATPVVLGIPLLNAVFLNLFMQTRTRTSFYPQIWIIVIFFILNVIQGSQAVKLEALFKTDLKGSLNSFFVIIAFLEWWSLLCIFCMCYFGRWNLELGERVAFWKSEKIKATLKTLQTAEDRGKKGQSTAVELLLHILVRAMNNIQEVEVRTGNPLLVESTELLRKFQATITNTDSLYAVQVESRDMPAEASENPTELTESALLEAQFYEIFANRKAITPQPMSAASSRTLSYQNNDSASALFSQRSSALKKKRTFPASEPIRNYAPPPKASAQFRRELGREWNCNMLKAAKEYPDILVEVGALLLEPKSAFLQTSPIRIRNYVYRLQRLYRVNPYHNSIHGAMVTHSLCCLLRMLNIYESPLFLPADSVAVVLAALGHDAGHPGRNNQFYINAFQGMALLYNDKSVLENYHSALVFKSFEPSSCDIFEALDVKTARDLRKKIISLILATDMGQYFEAIAKLRLRRQATGFNFITDTDDMWLVICMCMKCADLSHVFVDWPQHREWSIRLAEEFYQQGEEEAYMGLPKSPLCDRSRHTEFSKSQKSFIDFIVLPLISQINSLDKTDKISDNCLKNLTYNKYKWEEMYKAKESAEIPPEILAIRTDASACRLLLFHLFVPKGYRLARQHQNDDGTASRGKQHRLSHRVTPGADCFSVTSESFRMSECLTSMQYEPENGAMPEGQSSNALVDVYASCDPSVKRVVLSSACKNTVQTPREIPHHYDADFDDPLGWTALTNDVSRQWSSTLGEGSVDISTPSESASSEQDSHNDWDGSDAMSSNSDDDTGRRESSPFTAASPTSVPTDQNLEKCYKAPVRSIRLPSRSGSFDERFPKLRKGNSDDDSRSTNAVENSSVLPLAKCRPFSSTSLTEFSVLGREPHNLKLEHQVIKSTNLTNSEQQRQEKPTYSFLQSTELLQDA